LEATDVISFDIFEDIPPLRGPCRDISSSDDSYTTIQKKNDISVKILLYQLPLHGYGSIGVESAWHPPIVCLNDNMIDRISNNSSTEDLFYPVDVMSNDPLPLSQNYPALPFLHLRYTEPYPTQLHAHPYLQPPEPRQLSHILMRMNLEVPHGSTIGYATQALHPTCHPDSLTLNRKMKMDTFLSINSLQFMLKLQMVI
jgi:hypothetical protein